MNKELIPILSFPDTKMLSTFLKDAGKLLFDESKILWFQHPQGIDISNWLDVSHQDFMKAKNKHITEEFLKRSGVYAIWEKRKQKVFLVYIGQTTDKTSHQRVINHFIVKDPRTGSKLDKVQNAISNGSIVGVTFVQVKPKQMRQYLEQMLIQEKKEFLGWNIMGKG